MTPVVGDGDGAAIVGVGAEAEEEEVGGEEDDAEDGEEPARTSNSSGMLLLGRYRKSKACATPSPSSREGWLARARAARVASAGRAGRAW